MRQKSKIKKEKVAVDSVLPMLPQVLQYLVGSYAWEKPLHRLKSYEESCSDRNPKLTGGKLIIDSTGSHYTFYPIKDMLQISRGGPNFPLALTPIEIDFFKHIFPNHPNKFVIWQRIAKEGIALITMQNREGVVAVDKLFLKLSSPDNKVLKAAGLLPKKLKNKADT
jgi:hypothetical protein